jgi:hypothetical protein
MPIMIVCAGMSSSHFVPAVVGAGPEFVVQLSPLQRSTLGIPTLGDSYWNAETIGLLAHRYPGIDVTPYLKHSRL